MIGGTKKVEGQIKKVLTDDKIITAVAQEMLCTILCRESEIMMRKAGSFNQNNIYCILTHSPENAAMCHQ